MRKTDALNLTGAQALFVLSKAIAEKKVTRSDVSQYLGEVDREVDALEARIEALRELSGDGVSRPSRKPAARTRAARRKVGQKATAKKAAAKKSPPKVSKETAASQKLQGVYLSLLRQVPASSKTKYKVIVAKQGREAAIEAMKAALNKK